MKYRYILLLLISSYAFAQSDSVYTVPFPDGSKASKENTIALTIANTSAAAAQNISINIANHPSWVKFDTTKLLLSSILASTEQSATFTFSVDPSAPIGKEQRLVFTITANGQTWTKNISIKVAAPATYQLFQNYPNPFNPSTTISYQLSEASRVSLKIFDILGREVVSLIDEQQDAGYYKEVFNARRFASGMYFTQLIAVDGSNKNHTFRKKMLLLK